MKKFMALMIIFALVVSFVACGGAKNDFVSTEPFDVDIADTIIEEIAVTDESEKMVVEIESVSNSSTTDNNASDTLNGLGGNDTVNPSSSNGNSSNNSKPIEKPTQKPTEPPTENSTQKPTELYGITFEEVGIEQLTQDMKEYAASIGLVFEPMVTLKNAYWSDILKYNKTDDYSRIESFKKDMKNMRSEGHTYFNFYCELENNQFVVYELYA